MDEWNRHRLIIRNVNSHRSIDLILNILLTIEPIEKICPLHENDWGRRHLRHQRVGLKQLVAQSYLYDHSQSLSNINRTEVPILMINLQSSISFET